MNKQALIIGLGQFGLSVAKSLSEKGVEVIAIDPKKSLVDDASLFVEEAIVMDATDEEELARLRPGKRDFALCAIGDDSKEASIITTALLRQMGNPYIVSRASDAIHRRILKLVGAHLVVNPELEYGNKFANKLLFRNIIVDHPLNSDLQLTEIEIQPSMIGKTLIDLELPRRYGVIVAGVRKKNAQTIIQPSPSLPLTVDDNMIIVSSEKSLAALMKGFEK